MSKKVVVERIGQTDTYHNAWVAREGDGSVTITVLGRNKQRVTYASGRWTKVTEDGIQEGKVQIING